MHGPKLVWYEGQGRQELVRIVYNCTITQRSAINCDLLTASTYHISFWNLTDSWFICTQCVCSTSSILHSTSNPNCHMTIQNKNDCQLTSTFSHFLVKCHLNVTCLILCVISISNVSINMLLFFSQVTLHVKFWIVRVTWHALCLVQVFACQKSKTCKSFVKKCTLYARAQTSTIWGAKDNRHFRLGASNNIRVGASSNDILLLLVAGAVNRSSRILAYFNLSMRASSLPWRTSA